MFEGISSSVYGGIYGPYLQLQLYWYRNSPTVTNTGGIIVQIGSKINEAIGKDYYICGSGDYYGNDPSTLQSDLDYSGYNNGACSYRVTSSSVQFTYTRDILTYDSFDYQLTSTFQVCLIASQTACLTVTPPVLIPSMTVKSALQAH